MLTPLPLSRLVGLLILGLALTSPPVDAAVCDSTSKRLVPLTELGAATYAGLTYADEITPLDTLGAPSPDGRIVLLSVGMSNTTQEYQAFIPLANGSGLKN